MSGLHKVKAVLSDQKGVAHLVLPLIILATISLVVLGKAQTTTKFDGSQVKGIIAKNGGDNPGHGTDENRRGSSEEVRSEQQKKNPDEKNKPDNKEIDNRENNKENNRETSVLRVGTKNKIQPAEDRNDNVEKDEATKSAGEEDEEASGSAGQTEDEEIHELRSISKFPLRIDTSTNQLIMTKNGVERVLATLPAKAVQNMLRAHLKKGLGPKFFQASSSAELIGTPSATPVGTSSATPSVSPTEEPIATDSADITVLGNQISLEEENGQIVYKIPAKKRLRLFGFIPVNTDLTGFVSAQTGILIEERQSLLSRILDFLSP